MGVQVNNEKQDAVAALLNTEHDRVIKQRNESANPELAQYLDGYAAGIRYAFNQVTLQATAAPATDNAEVARLRAALEAVLHANSECPVCGSEWETRGHARTCEIAAALATTPQPAIDPEEEVNAYIRAQVDDYGQPLYPDYGLKVTQPARISAEALAEMERWMEENVHIRILSASALIAHMREWSQQPEEQPTTPQPASYPKQNTTTDRTACTRKGHHVSCTGMPRPSCRGEMSEQQEQWSQQPEEARS